VSLAAASLSASLCPLFDQQNDCGVIHIVMVVFAGHRNRQSLYPNIPILV